MTEQTGGKFSVYVKDGELKHSIELIARYDGVSITELISKILQDYMSTRSSDLEFIRRQEEERENRKQQSQYSARAF